MDTREHTELGNALRFEDWDTLQENPLINFDANGTLLLDLQGLDANGIPKQINLQKTPVGEIVAMSGDYFGGREVAFDLPFNYEFRQYKTNFDRSGQCKTLGQFLNKLPISSAQAQKLICSYKRLANEQITKEDIATIYKIDGATYIPVFKTLNSYMQQLMFALRVKNYSEILNRNLSHFTPWSVRTYTIGHYLALQYARIYFELKQFANDPDYTSDNQEFNDVRSILENTPNGFSAEHILGLAHRYQALSLSMEFFCFHYYTDHFAAGHGAFIGDLRAVLPERFGTLGSILVNNLHDELNRVTVYTKKAYDPTPNPQDPPIITGGDGDFSQPNNHFNKLACLAGMKSSLEDLNTVFKGGKIPEQTQYGGLEYMPDVDEKYRQPQPLIILGDDNKVYYRTYLSKINTLSPSQLQKTFAEPLNNGYTELTNKWGAFLLVFKLRILSFFFEGKMQTLTSTQLKEIESEELKLNPNRAPIQELPTTPARTPAITIPSWQTPAREAVVNMGLRKHSFLSSSATFRKQSEELELNEQASGLELTV